MSASVQRYFKAIDKKCKNITYIEAVRCFNTAYSVHRKPGQARKRQVKQSELVMAVTCEQ